MSTFRSIHILLLFLPLLTAGFAFGQTAALPNAHAHNDYKHKKPLQDAMAYGFTSIEADIFLKHNRFIVAHISPFLKKATLETLYLQPLSDSIKKHSGYTYKDYKQPVILLIDIKTDAEKTYSALKPLLEKYASVLTRVENGKMIAGGITVILSGNKPYAGLKNETLRYAFIDENLLRTEKDDHSVCPLTSAKYSNIIRWKGKGNMPQAEKEKLMGLTTAAHEQGKKVRLWASPESTAVWTELIKCGVDLISTDDLEKLSGFLKKL